MEFVIQNINANNEEGLNLASPYVLNISNNTNTDNVITVFDAFNEIEKINNTTINGINLYDGNTLLITLYSPTSYQNGLPRWDFSISSVNWRLFSNGISWVLRKISFPINTQWVLNQQSELPIPDTATWEESLTPPYDFSNFNTAREIGISCSLPGVTYADILQQSASKPFNVGKTYIYSDNVLQTNQTYNLIVKDANGNISKHSQISSSIDPYQEIANAITDYAEYTIDGNTGINFKTKANSSMIMMLYPKLEATITDELTTGEMLEEYDSPTPYNKELEIEEEPKETILVSTKKTKSNNNTALYIAGALLSAYLLNKVFKWV